MKKLLLIGCGGTGSDFISLFARWNSYTKMFDTVYLIDGDIVETKNLERQQFNPSDVGFKKSDALCRNLFYSGYELISGPKQHIIIAEVMDCDMVTSPVSKGKFYVQVTSVYMIRKTEPLRVGE